MHIQVFIKKIGEINSQTLSYKIKYYKKFGTLYCILL